MTKAKRTLQDIIEPVVTALGYEFVGFKLSQADKRCLLQVYVDDKNGITIDAITKISRQISAVMDVEEPIHGKYSLEVSSPGLNRPLFQPEHYQSFVGRKIKVNLHVPKNQQRNFSGVLKKADDKQITLETEGGNPIDISFDEIGKANLIPELKTKQKQPASSKDHE